MMSEIKAIRMCISCRDRFVQNRLLRLCCIDKEIKPFKGVGRSFYLCDNCLKEDNRIEKILYRECKNKDNYLSRLKEILLDDRQSKS